MQAQLTPPERAEILERQIVPAIVGHITPSPSPKAYIVGGQPGSGKSVFASTLLHNEPNTVFINGDELRSYHPRYTHFLGEDALNAADHTQEDVNHWIELLIQFCLTHKLSIIVEGTMRTLRAPLATATLAQQYGYYVCGAVVSAPKELSLASTVYRYEEAKKKGGDARYTKKMSHDEAYDAVPDTVQALIESGYFHEFLIGKREQGGFTITAHSPLERQEMQREFLAGRERVLDEQENEFVRLHLPYAEHQREISMK
jgi:UDP-N-acetylglucosamine kinase